MYTNFIYKILIISTYFGGSPSSSGIYNLLLEVSLINFCPSKDHTAPVTVRILFFKVEETATGAEHPPPNVFRNERSHTHLKVVSTSYNGSKRDNIFQSVSRHSTPNAPCPTAYNASSGSNSYGC